MRKKTFLWRGLAAFMAVLLGISVGVTAVAGENAGMVNNALGLSAPTMPSNESALYYKSEFTSTGAADDTGLAALKKASADHVILELEEGSVLLMNNNNALPLAENERSVTLFGRASADVLYKNKTPGAQISTERQITYYDAMKNAGFQINDTLYNAYASSSTGRDYENGNIGEEPQSFYTAALKDSYASSYNDAAIVMISRTGGEDADFVFDASKEAAGVPQLALHKDEADLLKMIKDSGKFGKVIVLINSGNPMDLSWLDKDEYGVDACLWIGLPGLTGMEGVVNLLTGKANPSGRLVDTWATSSLSSPAMQNFGDFGWANTDGKYLIQSEGIYVGYKYYESRYYDAMLGQFNADSATGRTETISEGGQNITLYDESTTGWDYGVEMAYPFGYGLSYSDFTQEIVPGSFAYNADTDEFTVSVKVTNVSGPAGKSVVELYVSAPYTQYDQDNLVEKSAITLVGFAKTDTIQPGVDETVTITFSRYLLASYDENNAKGYILDDGDYYIAIGNDAHDALNNILAMQLENGVEVVGTLIDEKGNEVAGDAAKAEIYTLSSFDSESYRNSLYNDGVEVTNKFVGDSSVDVNDFLPESQKIVYLTRGGGGKDWSSSYPTPAKNVSATDQMISILNETYSTPAGAPSADSLTKGVDAGIKFVEMKDVPFEDEKWDTFVAQMAVADLRTVLDDSSGIKLAGGESFMRPATYHTDGPDGTSRTFSDGTRGTLFSAGIVAASTWNEELVLRRGELIAEECMYVNTQMIWGPGVNLHRTPYGGRNCEYYSECPILSYYMASAQCKGTSQKGILCSIKHYFANTQETNRKGVATFATEQAFRETEMKGFEGAVTAGEALALMNALNRIGLKMAFADAAALQDILRDEWGFKGLVTSDAYTGPNNDYLLGLSAGTDTWCLNSSVSNAIVRDITSDGHLLQSLQNSNKYVAYAFSRSTLVNNLTADTVVTEWTPWWQTALKAVNITLAVLACGFTVLTIVSSIPNRKEKRA